MDVIWLVILVSLFPLMGIVWKGMGLTIASVAGGLLLLVSILLAPSKSARVLLMSQVPLLGSTALFGLYLLKQREKPNGSVPNGTQENNLIELKQTHAALKEAVMRGDNEEAKSLQIYAMAKGLAEALSWPEMVPHLNNGIQKIFNSHEYLLYSVEEDGQFKVLHQRGHWTKTPPLGDEIPAEAALVYPPRVVELVPVLCVPVRATSLPQEGPNGILFVKMNDKVKSDQELVQLGVEFGEQLGMALNKALLFSQMEMHSRTDGLTGTLRRQAFMDRLGEELRRASAFHTPFGLMMVDIDHFKSINDSYGHDAGDAVLAKAGQILKSSLYETDVVGRYGGEEFIVLLSHGEAEGVFRKAEAIRRRFQNETIACGFASIRITVSVGVAHFPKSGRSADELIKRADAALYNAKEGGRNKVVAA